MAQSKRPNIVYLLADQLRYQSCGYAGDSKAQTPNIDQLSQQGMSFSNAVVSMPVCSAYRATLFTGKYTTSTGMVINEIRMNTNHQCLAHCLTEAGYQSGYIGKWHLWANQLGNHADSKNSYVPPGPYRLGFDDYWAAYNFRHHYYSEAYYHENSPEKIFYGDGVYEPDAQTDMAIDFLRKKSKAENPFVLFVSYGTPHDPWTKDNVPEEYYNRFKDVDFPPPPTYRQENDEPYGDLWSNMPKDPEKLDEWMRVYYAMTANLDWNVGRIQATISELGIEEDTLFIFTSDHGEMFGAHGRMKKNIFYEEAARVPFLMKMPGTIPAGHVSNACFCNVDIMPTLLGFAEANIPQEAEGMDLSHLACGKPGPEPEFAFLQNTGACALWENGHEWRAIRDGCFTYAIYKVDGAELLFDNINDPLQTNNLADDPASQSTLVGFRLKLKQKMEVLNDTFEESLWYKEHWVSEDRMILRTATVA